MYCVIVCICVLWQITILKPTLSISEWEKEDSLDIQKREGALFLKKGSVLMSGDTWTLTFDVTFHPYRLTAETIIEETDLLAGYRLQLYHILSQKQKPPSTRMKAGGSLTRFSIIIWKKLST